MLSESNKDNTDLREENQNLKRRLSEREKENAALREQVRDLHEDIELLNTRKRLRPQI